MCPPGRLFTSTDMYSLSQPILKVHLQPRFVTPGDIGHSAKGLKRLNVENTCAIPRKLKHRPRTAKEKGTPTYQDVLPLLNEIEQCSSEYQVVNPPLSVQLTLSTFEVNGCDQLAESSAKSNYFNYIKLKVTSSSTMCNLQEYLQRLSKKGSTEQSAYTYLKVINKNADSDETILEALCTLHKELDIGQTSEYLVVAGDYKSYNHIQTVKVNNGKKLDWVIPFPGDFHTLHNYQEALMKIYWDAGLKQIASGSGYRGETLTKLGKCSNFTTTTNFLFQVWEAIYSHMYATFDDTSDSKSEKAFTEFLNQKSSHDDNWRFWTGFVQEDCLAFINLYLSVRGGDWDLRLVSLKQMAAIFNACDRPHYSKLIPQHLADCAKMPQTIIDNFSKGGFVVSITGRNWHSVSFDEAHEMLINKDLKTAIVRPNAEYMTRLSLFFTHRTRALKNFRQIIEAQEKNDTFKKEHTLHNDFSDNTITAQKRQENVTKMREIITSSSLLPSDRPETETLRNSFTGEIATPEQRQDLLNARKIGQNDFIKHVQINVLQVSSAKRTKHKKHNLHTFAKQKVTKRKLTEAEQQKKVVSLCLRKRLMAQCQQPTLFSKTDQYLELPRAIADANGLPHKSDKKNARDYFHNRYDILLPQLPINWFPDAIILKGKFMIQSIPFPGCTMEQYTAFLLDKYTKFYINLGVPEIHIVFDHANRQEDHPKQIERQRRNATCHHNHTMFHDSLKAPSKWRDHLDCTVCKRRIVNYIGNSILQMAKSLLTGTQKMIVSGFADGNDQDKAFFSTSTTRKVCDPKLTCNAEEADTRLWLHVNKSTGQKKLIYSPDTDTLFIGIGIVNTITTDVVIQISKGATDKKFIHLNNLVTAINEDVDLQHIPQEDRTKVIQSLFVLSGSDFTSYFVGLGKVAFFKAFYAYAEFISGDSGILSHLLHEDSYLAFLRLIGVLYFQKHRSGFMKYNSPMTHFNSQKNKQPQTTALKLDRVFEKGNMGPNHIRRSTYPLK